jgi:uncharacterized secreted protein with C-terminal beta-propeller domain
MLRRLSVLAIASVLAIVSLHAQFDSGQISGYVRDTSLAVIAGATITAINEGSNDRHTATTNANGYYVFANLPVGKYTVTAEVPGFKKTLETGVTVDAASRVSVDLTMTVGALSESVEVQASASQVQTESAQVGRVVETKQIQDLTLNGRNPIYLALLKPGVQGGGNRHVRSR